MAMAVGGVAADRRPISTSRLLSMCCWCLLIIFMVITPLTPHGLNALVPQPPPPNQPPPPPDQDPNVVIEIKADHSMQINSRSSRSEKICRAASPISLNRAPRRLSLSKGDKDLEYRYVAQAIDAAKGADPDMKVGIMTPKDRGGTVTSISFRAVSVHSGSRAGRLAVCTVSELNSAVDLQGKTQQNMTREEISDAEIKMDGVWRRV